MLTIGIDVVLLLAAGVVIACFVAVVARCCGMDKEFSDSMSYTAMATSILLTAFYIAMSYVLDSLC